MTSSRVGHQRVDLCHSLILCTNLLLKTLSSKLLQDNWNKYHLQIYIRFLILPILLGESLDHCNKKEINS